MTYGIVIQGHFLKRPNRFIAHVETQDGIQICHVKNTGRCRELLVPGAVVYLEESPNPNRKTKYDLIAVEKGDLLINMDSQAPNQVAEEYLPRLFPDMTGWRREFTWGSSRFDFRVETPEKTWFMEVKGVTLEENGVVLFPDAPTQRGVKHLRELCRCQEEGYGACVLFVVQMSGIHYFTPNRHTHPEFAQALEEAALQGVRLEAVDCLVTPQSLIPGEPVEIRLDARA
ncbi:sugar fermentation stimulation protein homolog [Clostridium sp. CAG:1013]|nr:sugar fermentation stimulation protein homolog [Clostridium sp. CAG:1013]